MATNTNPNPHKSDDPSPAAPANAEGQWPGAFTAFAGAFDQLKKNPQPALLFLGVYAVLAIISSVGQDDVSYFSTERWNYEDILYLVFLLALPVYGFALADRKVISLSEFMRFDATKYFTLLGALLLFALVIFGSALLLLVPLIWTVAWFSLIPYAVVDKGTGVIGAFKESKRLARNHKAKVWGAIGVTVLYSIIATLFAVIPYIGSVAIAFVTLLSWGAFAILYRWLQQNDKSLADGQVQV
ncbi:MAG: hypothetical protein M3332_03415 [Actinomycetota bacterium]|nr:hypothetical protein [Actinomycetota bacterium]